MTDSAPGRVTPPQPAKTVQKKAEPKEKSNRPRGRPPELQKQLEEVFTGIGMMTAVAINEFDGEVIRDNAASLAESWNKVAQQNATIKRILTSIMETSAWSGAIASTAAVAIPIMQNHKAIPASVPHPFAKPPWISGGAMNQRGFVVDPNGGVQQQFYYEDPTMPGVKVPMVPPQEGSPITPSGAKNPPEPPPGQHKYGSS